MSKSYYSFGLKTSIGEIVPNHCNFLTSQNCLYTSGNNNLLVWNTKTQELVKSLPGPELITSLAQTNSKVAAGFRNGQVLVWDSSTLNQTHEFSGHEGAVSALVFSKDGLSLYSGSFDTTIVVWDLVGDSPQVRLQSHKDAVTSLVMAEEYLVSGSRDKMVKVWDLDSEMCIQTLLQSKEVWNLDLHQSKLYVSGRDKYLNVWETQSWTEQGSLSRSMPKGRTKVLEVHKAGVIMVGFASGVEFWRVKDEKEMEKLLKRRRKRLREKHKEGDPQIVFSDHYEKVLSFNAQDKVVSASWFKKTQKSKTHEAKLSFAVSYNTNFLEVYTFEVNLTSNLKTGPKLELQQKLEKEGHRSPARTLSLSSDNWTLASASGETLKLWDLETNKCIVTQECEYALNCRFLPGERCVLVTTRSGKLQVFDVLSKTKVYEKQAHEGPVWGLEFLEDLVITGAADQELKFWSFSSKFKLKLVEVFTMKDEVLGLRVSDCKRYICCALLDSTIHLLHSDTKKLYLSLYGHKLPVTSFDVSDDSRLLVSGAADKNLKIWGMDYGDCHKSIFGHQQPVTSVVFVRGTHFFFSGSRDRLIKYWNADTYECILKLLGHTSEVWCLAISTRGDFLVSSSNDLSIKVWAQSQEQVFLQEEREKELEESAKPEEIGLVRPKGEAVPLLQTTSQALKSGEALMEALDIARQYKEHLEEGGESLPPPHFGGLDSKGYIFKVLKSVPSPYLNSVLHLLPFVYAKDLIEVLESYLDQEVELCTQCILVLVKIHESTIITSSLNSEEWVVKLSNLKNKIQTNTRTMKDLIGKNWAGSKLIHRRIKEEKTSLDVLIT